MKILNKITVQYCKYCNLKIELQEKSLGSKRWYHVHNDSRYCCNIKANEKEV